VSLACDCGCWGSRASSAASAYDLGGRWCSARSSGAEGSGFSDMASDGLRMEQLGKDAWKGEWNGHVLGFVGAHSFLTFRVEMTSAVAA
jgi:hypothetical protein